MWEPVSKKIFLIDGLGALVSVFMLGFVWPWQQSLIGMPLGSLRWLAIIPIPFVFYSLGCHFFLRSQRKCWLFAIALANFSYCLLSMAFLVRHRSLLQPLGWIYFLGEIFILFGLIYMEVQIALQTHEK